MEASLQRSANFDSLLRLLLFVDKRPVSNERIRQIRSRLKELATDAAYPYELEVVDVSEKPYLAENFKLVATPSLIKIHPKPRQTLAGEDLIAQLDECWSRWQRSIEEYEINQQAEGNSKLQNQSISQSSDLLQLSDQIFQLEREKERLQAQLQFKDQLIAILAHDLRNPLTTLSIALETLELGMTREAKHPRMTPELLAQIIRQARTQARSLDRMITDILQVARDRGDELSIQPGKVDLGRLCLEVIDRLNEQFEAKSHSIKTDIPSDLPRVYVDPERIRQVVVNLLDNAIKYTPKQGKITLSILHRTTQKVQVSICDTGPGIPDENQTRIFDDRFRLQRDQAQDGYGIGLALCKRVIQAHYGQIWVDSTPKGSCFHFTLPVYHHLQLN